MKNETARREIESLDYYLQNHTSDYSEESHMAMMMAIKALEAQPSEDCISREEVQDLISRWLSDYLLDETREALETINYKIGDMPSVNPQRKKGKWIKVITHKDDFGETWHFKCSICGEKSNKGYRPLENYCHNCGAEMDGGGEDGAETR